jgi:hypothetical protein
MRFDGSETAQSAPRGIQLVAIVAAIVLAIGAACFWFFRGHAERPFVRPFAESSEIESMEASEVNVGLGGRRQTFQVPPEHWELILAALLPAQQDEHPAKWESFGTLEIKRSSGDSDHINLFVTGSDPGAFSIGQTYYRGGNSTDLTRAVTKAFKETEKKKRAIGNPQ